MVNGPKDIVEDNVAVEQSEQNKARTTIMRQFTVGRIGVAKTDNKQ